VEPDSSQDRLSDRRLVGVLAGTAVAALVVLLAVLGGRPGDGGDAAGTDPDTPTTTVDLSSVPNEELERVVAENPDIVPMRLRLVERYLRGNELANAQLHAEQALVRATTIEDRARAQRYLGWTTALLGDPEQGEGLIVQSLALDPSNRDGLYFLARVRFELLEDPAGALEPLEILLATDMDDEQRILIETLHADVQAATAATTTTTTP
jgi:cytochrome c-type biogenesis protein CcmH/NrfG